MKKYAVQVPFAGHFYVEVKAEDAEEAKMLALQANPFDKDSDADIMEIEYYEQMNRGNIFYGTLSEIDIEEMEDE